MAPSSPVLPASRLLPSSHLVGLEVEEAGRRKLYASRCPTVVSSSSDPGSDRRE